jgi:type 1 fimbriae regulatory protein FimB
VTRLSQGGQMENLSEKKRLYLMPQELEHLFAAIKKCRKENKRKRDLCLFKLMYSFGLRLSEIELIRLSDINLEDHLIYVRRLKRRKMRPGQPQPDVVPRERWGCWYSLSVENQRLLRDWLKVRVTIPYADQLPQLFISAGGRALDNQAIYWNFKRYAAMAALPWAHPHTLRHSCAIDLVKAGIGIQDVKKRLGHKQITSTEFYVEMLGQDRVERDQRMDEVLERRVK